jgi:hypothetical protein
MEYILSDLVCTLSEFSKTLENANLYFIEDRLHELLEVTGLLLFKVDV